MAGVNIESMTLALAFADLEARAPRQRARCVASGRFVAWSKVPQLRAIGAPRVVVIPSPMVVDDVAGVVTLGPVTVDASPPIVGRVAVAVSRVVAVVASVVAAIPPRITASVRAAGRALGRLAWRVREGVNM